MYLGFTGVTLNPKTLNPLYLTAQALDRAAAVHAVRASEIAFPVSLQRFRVISEIQLGVILGLYWGNTE